MKKLFTRLLKWGEGAPSRPQIAKNAATPAHHAALRHAETWRRSAVQVEAPDKVENEGSLPAKGPGRAGKDPAERLKRRRGLESPGGGAVEAKPGKAPKDEARRRALIKQRRKVKEAGSLGSLALPGNQSKSAVVAVAQQTDAPASAAKKEKLLLKKQRRAASAVKATPGKIKDKKHGRSSKDVRRRSLHTF